MAIIPPFKKLRIEINSDCNRKCVFCPRGTDVTRWKNPTEKRKKMIEKYMETDDVISILDQNMTQGFRAQVGFDFYNEATLDDRLLYFCEHTKKLGAPLEIVTNGDNLIDDETYTKKLFSLADFVVISLYDYKDYDGRKKLIDKWQRYLFGLGIDRGYQLAGDYFTFGNRAGLVDRRDKFMDKAELDQQVPIKANCKKVHSKMNIRYDGEVALCCEDSHIRYSLGNVLESSLRDVWYGEKMQEATKLLAAGNRAAIAPCSKCVKSIVKVK